MGNQQINDKCNNNESSNNNEHNSDQCDDCNNNYKTCKSMKRLLEALTFYSALNMRLSI